jgi:hypothetical protein
MGLDKSADKGNMKWQDYEPKKWEETDVEIQVSFLDPTFPSHLFFCRHVFRLDHSLRHLRL